MECHSEEDEDGADTSVQVSDRQRHSDNRYQGPEGGMAGGSRCRRTPPVTEVDEPRAEARAAPGFAELQLGRAVVARGNDVELQRSGVGAEEKCRRVSEQDQVEVEHQEAGAALLRQGFERGDHCRHLGVVDPPPVQAARQNLCAARPVE